MLLQKVQGRCARNVTIQGVYEFASSMLLGMITGVAIPHKEYSFLCFKDADGDSPSAQTSGFSPHSVSNREQNIIDIHDAIWYHKKNRAKAEIHLQVIAMKENIHTLLSAAVASALLLRCSALPFNQIPSAASSVDKKLIALTFDDGPNTTTTNDVLDILEQYHAKASFFLIGDNINEESAVTVKRAYDMGMEIDNHSKTHSNMSKMTAEEMQAEISFVDEKVTEIIGEPTKFFRPPFIDVSQAMYDAIDLPFICGIDCQDYMANVTAQERADYIMNGAKDGVIVLLHDAAGNQQTVDALKIVMPQLIEQDYEFVTLMDLFTRQGETPRRNIIYSNVGKYPTGYETMQSLSSDSADRIALDTATLEQLGNTYAIETDYSCETGYPPVIALQKWSGTPQIWHTIQPFYFNGEKAVFLAEDVTAALEQLGIGYSDLDGITVTAYTGQITLSHAKLMTKEAEQQKTAGDLNADGEENLADAVLLQKYLLTEVSALPNWQAGDMDENGRLNVCDLTLLKRLLMK